MRRIIQGVIAAVAIAGVASAAPVKLTKKELAKVTAGKITQQKTNPQGHVVSSNSEGQAIDTTNVNPQGKPPPGQN
jgi:hypothetical protein